MALPPLPGPGLPERPKPAQSGLPSLPDLSAPREPQISPALAPYVAQFAKKFGRQPNAVELERIALAVQKKAAQENAPIPPALPPQQPSKPASPAAAPAEDGWLIDEETGKRYKPMPGFKPGVMSSKSAVKSIASGNVSLEALRSMVEDVPDFSLDDLNGSAEMFLPHLRVPPDKEEQKRLAEERKARQKMFDAIAAREAEEELTASKNDE